MSSGDALTAEDVRTFMQEDLYKFMGCDPDISTKDLKKCYRKRAIQLHPDRNPSPDAGKQFDKLKKVFEFLSEDKHRQAYDGKRKAQAARQAKIAQEDDAIRAMRQKLEQREKEAAEALSARRQAGMAAAAKYQDADTIAAIRQKVRADKERAEREAHLNALRHARDDEQKLQADSGLFTVQVLWQPARPLKRKSMHSDPLGADLGPGVDHDETSLRNLFSPHGPISSLIVKPKKGKAFLVFSSRQAAVRLVACFLLCLILVWLDERSQ